MKDTIPIILLSGMAADERIFESQLARFPNLRVQPWIEPLPRESLQQYAVRLAQIADPGVPCLVGGASFGGVVAREMALHLRARACMLIGSIRSPAELPWTIRRFRPVAILGPAMLRKLAQLLEVFGRGWVQRSTWRQFKRLANKDASIERWAICSLLRWKASRNLDRVPTFQIHGSADAVLPVEMTQPDVTVPGGLHALTMFSPHEVNEFIARVIQLND